MNPILAFDFGLLFAIGFLLISFIGWIMNLINAQNPPPQPQQPARRPPIRDRKVQNEIEEFLQEAIGRRDPQQRQPVVGSDDIEIIEPAPQRRPPSQKQPQSRGSKPPATQRPPRLAQAQPPGQGLSERHIHPSAEMGQRGRSQAADHMQARMGAQVARDLPHQINQSVIQHLGEFRADDNDTRRDVAPVIRSRAAIQDATGLIAALREPAGMRRAIVLQQILAKPRALQRPRD